MVNANSCPGIAVGLAIDTYYHEPIFARQQTVIKHGDWFVKTIKKLDFRKTESSVFVSWPAANIEINRLRHELNCIN